MGNAAECAIQSLRWIWWIWTNVCTSSNESSMERVLRATTTTTTTTMDGSERRTISRWFQRPSWSSPNDELDSEYNDEYDENTRSLAFRTSSLVHHDPTNNFH